MNRSKTFRLAAAFAAASLVSAARAHVRADAGVDGPPQSFQMSLGHFHFEHGFDLGPPGSSVGAADPTPLPARGEDPAEPQFAPGLHYSGWRLPAERLRVARGRGRRAASRRKAPPVELAPAAEPGYWDRVILWAEAARTSLAQFARELGWLPVEPIPEPSAPKLADAARRPRI